MRDLESLTRHLARPAVHVVTRTVPSRSHFGGVPELPAGVEWPAWSHGRLAFLARIELSELQGAHRIPWLPASGSLLFFYDVEKQPWGFDPKDRGGAAVIYAPDVGRRSERRFVPMNGDDGIAFRYVDFTKIESLPSWNNDAIRALSLSDEEHEAYMDEQLAPFKDAPKHQVAGYPTPIQNDTMEFECQVVSHGIYLGDSADWESPRARALEAGARDWRLLLQLDTDEDLGVMWGDGGTIYFWIREADAAARRFDQSWLILQCS